MSLDPIPLVSAQSADTSADVQGGGDADIPLTTRSVFLPAVDARGLSLGILAVVAATWALSWAQAFVVPLLFGIVVSYTLYPMVSWLAAIKVPRAVGSAIVVTGVMGALIFGIYSLRGQMHTIIDELPEAATKISASLEAIHIADLGNMQKIQTVATEVEKAATKAAGNAVVARQAATHVIVDQPAFKVSTFLWRSSMGTLGALGQAAVVIVLSFFLLIGGNKFKRSLVRITGPSFSRKKITVNILNDINRTIQRYLLMMLVTNALVAVLSWILFRWIGLENAGAWSAAAGLLHIVPYVGPVVTSVATAMAAFLQFNSLSMALLVGGASMIVAMLVGTFLSTWMTGRIASMNPAAVFISVMFWGWLWGVWGMLLSVPLIVIIKVISEHLEGLHPVAELLSASK